MKFAEDIFPLGTFKKQKTAGAYIDKDLAHNLDIYVKKIAKDMHFLGIISGHDMVGDGKSTMMTQIGTYLTWKINKLHKVNNTFTNKNLVFGSKILAERSFELPKLSVVCLDEGDDLTTHGMKELAVRLKRYFRKCRQLNQIIILILPSFFELPKFFALSRSHFLIDVKFEGEFERGFYSFYGPKAKKQLYLKGKKDWNYESHPPDLSGRFFSSYCFFPDLEKCIEGYKKEKYDDMIDDAKWEEEIMTKKDIYKKVLREVIHKLEKNLPEITQRRKAEALGIPQTTYRRFSQLSEEDSLKEVEIKPEPTPKSIIIPN